jgi:hypothetical protein
MFMLGSNHFLQVNFDLRLLEVKGDAITRLLALFGALGVIGTLVRQFLIRAAYGIDLLGKCSK